MNNHELIEHVALRVKAAQRNGHDHVGFMTSDMADLLVEIKRLQDRVKEFQANQDRHLDRN